MTFSIETFNERLKLFPETGEICYPKVRISKDLLTEAYQWCEDQFGYEWIWSNRFQTEYIDIYFLNESDAMLFRLKFASFTPLDALW